MESKMNKGRGREVIFLFLFFIVPQFKCGLFCFYGEHAE
jgi:hypothetical protein